MTIGPRLLIQPHPSGSGILVAGRYPAQPHPLGWGFFATDY
jgi:hypothetical protein